MFMEAIISLVVSKSGSLVVDTGEGRLDGVKPNAVFYTKMFLVVAAIALQLALLIKIVFQDEYRSSSLLSAIVPDLDLPYPFMDPGISRGAILYPPALETTLLPSFMLENVSKPNHAQLTRPNATVVVQANFSPELSSNYFAQVAFFWLLPLLNLGKKKTLRMDDLWSLHPKLLSYPLYLTIKAKMDADEALTLQKIRDERARGTSPSESKKGRINFFWIVFQTIGYGFMTVVIPRLLYIVALYVRPILFSNLITFVNSYSEVAKIQGTSPQSAWIGFGLLIALVASAVLASLFDNQFQNICYNSSLKGRGVMITQIYRKSLRLSSTSKQEGMGAIVNHMSTDVDKVVEFLRNGHYMWSAALEIIITIVLLYAEVKYAIFASYPRLCSCGRVRLSSEPKSKGDDETIGPSYEAHHRDGQLHTWEHYFTHKISKARNDQLQKLQIVQAVVLTLVVPFSIFAILSVYTVIAKPDESLDIRRIFTTITLINMLDDPISYLNFSLSTVISGMVAYKRLAEFLRSEKMDDKNVQRNLDPAASKYAYEVSEDTFGWYSPEAIRVAVKKKEKEAKEAARKMTKRAAKASAEGDEKSDKEEKYDENEKGTLSEEESSITTLSHKKVPSERSLSTPSPDNVRDSMGPVLHNINLRIKRGSLTAVVGRVGEGKSSLGINLSGGQKQRISIARAVYADAYVGEHIFVQVLTSILAKKTHEFHQPLA
ncbi:Canalicular multispecific organic anion transporter 2 [Modicella reniformis]|uniref:Canalicular multispecific organic anion transporter 2 n=1 Tax=Modicella reniformis TaxID=1440133 RepID=A0A9P6ILL8_9FUNG|nr:Canalicular multispecific organic anion transporter 2 [Modicella reniformis]